MNRAAPAALLCLTLLRLVVAARIPLSPDEAYYWVWSRALTPGYLDHPPMVALWIRTGTAIVGESPLGIRLLAPLSGAAGSLLLAQAAGILMPGRNAGIIAAALMNATLLFGVGAVTMTPDTPLLFFWTAALWALARMLRSGRGAWFLAAGLATGLALASKYTAVFLILGTVVWLLIVPALRVWWRRPEPWLGAAVGGLVFLPVLLWNAAHEWASFVKQGGRTGAWDPARALQFLGELIGGQIGLATPLIFLLCCGGVVLAARLLWRGRAPGPALLAAMTVPPALVFLQHALGDRVQGNWPAIIYPAASIAATGLRSPRWVRLRAPAVALGAAISFLAYAQASLPLVALPARIDPTTLRLAGWGELAGAVEAFAQQTGASFVAADDYGIAAELALGVSPSLPVLGAEPRWGFFDLTPAPLEGQTGLLIRSTRRGEDVDRSDWQSIEAIGQVARSRGGETIETFRVYRVTGRPGLTGRIVVMPRPN